MGRSLAIASIGAAGVVFLWCAASALWLADTWGYTSVLSLALYAAVSGGSVVAAWNWAFRRRLSAAATFAVARAFVFGGVLVAVFEVTAPIRSAFSAAWFPYVIWLRFGFTGAIVFWVILDTIAIGAVVWAMVALGNLTSRSTGP